MVGLEAQLLVGFDRVEALVLQFVGLELGQEADAASFLLLVDQHASAGLGDHLQRHLELLLAIAAQRPEDVAGQALRVDAHQRRLRVQVPHYQRHRGFQAALRPARGLPFEAHDAEMSPAGREVRFRHLAEVVGAAHALIIT